jgi:hypothetical protein
VRVVPIDANWCRYCGGCGGGGDGNVCWRCTGCNIVVELYFILGCSKLIREMRN